MYNLNVEFVCRSSYKLFNITNAKQLFWFVLSSLLFKLFQCSQCNGTQNAGINFLLE